MKRALALAVVASLSLFGCRRKHIRVSSVPEIAYPTCGASELPPGEVIAAQHLRVGPTSLEHNVVEHYEIRHRGCVTVATIRQEWPRAASDVEVIYDADGLPLRVWKRQTIPGVTRADGMADIHRYELRTPEVTIKHRGSDGTLTYEILRGPRPRFVIAPGRGLTTVWIQRAHLAVGELEHGPALDVREQVEVIRDVTLLREPDRYLNWYGGMVRVYTYYGRETVYTNDRDEVIGDLAGLQLNSMLHTPEPPPLPTYGQPDPIGTP